MIFSTSISWTTLAWMPKKGNPSFFIVVSIFSRPLRLISATTTFAPSFCQSQGGCCSNAGSSTGNDRHFILETHLSIPPFFRSVSFPYFPPRHLRGSLNSFFRISQTHSFPFYLPLREAGYEMTGLHLLKRGFQACTFLFPMRTPGVKMASRRGIDRTRDLPLENDFLSF